MNNRRTFLAQSIAGAAGLSLSSQSLFAAAPLKDKPPARFIFIHKGNGLLPQSLVPPTFTTEQMESEQRKEAFEVDLDKHDLPEWMSPIADHKKDLTILQGLSGKMCTTGHHTWCSSLGVFKANERLSSIKWATVDFELAKLFPSPFGHIELACFPSGGGNSRGNVNGIEKGFSARGPQQPNYAFGSPKVAMQELYKSVSTDQAAKAHYELERKMLEFVATGERAQGFNLSDIFEYMPPAVFEQVYATILGASAPGARLVYWNMMAPRRVPAAHAGRVTTLTALEDRLKAQDMAFFYSDLVVEEVRG